MWRDPQPHTFADARRPQPGRSAPRTLTSRRLLEDRWPRLALTSALPTTSSDRPAVLFAHGMWHAGWAWENWLGHFAARGYAAHAVDLRGHGNSEGDWQTARLTDHVDDVRRAVAALPEPPVLVGHSLGGLLVQHLLAAATYPAAIVVASVPGRYPPSVIAREAARAPFAAAASALRRDLRAYVATTADARRTLFTHATPDDIVHRTWQRLTGASPRLVREMLITKPPPPAGATPTLVLAGGRDPLFGARMQDRLARRIGAELTEIAGCGHDIPLDTQWRDAARISVDWLEQTLTDTPDDGEREHGARHHNSRSVPGQR